MQEWEIGASGAMRGRPLRYVLVQLLHNSHGAMTVRDLIAGCEAAGVVFDDRASKLISDALRWEVRRGRVSRLARGVYAFAGAPRSTMWRIRRRVAEYFDRLAELCERRLIDALDRSRAVDVVVHVAGASRPLVL